MSSRDRPVIGITTSRGEPPTPYIEAVEAAQGVAHPLPMAPPLDIPKTLDAIDGLLLTGGPDIDPACYRQAPDPTTKSRPQRDAVELPLVRAALERDIPILGICRGMQALNVVLGGSLIQDLPGHRVAGSDLSAWHEVFIPPGVRLTTILGVAGFMKVNSMHHQGIKWAQKAPGLLVSAYSLKDKDGIIEAIESPTHRWVVGVQWHPERRDEVPGVFQNLFIKFVAAARERPRQA